MSCLTQEWALESSWKSHPLQNRIDYEIKK